jgi:hypothetical protein
MRTLAVSSPGARSSATTSAWSFMSWAFLVLAALTALGMGVWWLALRPAVSEPDIGPAADMFRLLGVGAAWWLALACAVLGALCGLIGVASPATRTKSAWGAVAFNATVIAVSLVLLFALTATR